MKKVYPYERIPIKLWLDDMETGAMQQAMNLANLPFSFKHIAIMPDAHQGYGMPIGGVMATKGVVIPNAVGVEGAWAHAPTGHRADQAVEMTFPR